MQPDPFKSIAASLILTLSSDAFIKRCDLLAEAKKNEVENTQRAEWLKHKGMDTFVAMQLYIEKVRELAQVYQERVKN